MERPEERDWAAAHYRVERDSTGLKASRRKLRKIAEDAARHGDPIPEEARDVVRIYDRAGRVVAERDWGQNRQAAIDEEARIVDDLLKLDVVRFRATYGISPEEADEHEPGRGVPHEAEVPRPADAARDEPEGKPEGGSG